MRRIASRSIHAWFALTATLLVALVPSLGRLAGHAAHHGAGNASPAVHALHHHAAGMAGHGAMGHPGHRPAHPGGSGHDTRGKPHRAHGDADCDYCLLISTAPPPPPILAERASIAGGLPRVDGRSQVTTYEAPSPALGSRGPPAA